ncbi:hypothetical protein GX51_00167 [Blastomyces parvus]|uniref:J domain-containing protein n=1 Tax=Blastomyces parvus TaxID=2060905 RepID=A0A2B7XP86_9EURO|nr:hypothetical protein GX51_00167 [Blastomyces parvus]
MSDPAILDPYKVLGITKDATIAEIKSAHRKLVLKCHPDKIKDEEQRKDAVPEFQKVQSAYELLSDDKKRSEYDYKVELKKRSAFHSEDAGSSPYHRSSTFTKSYEYRDGVRYEERVPKKTSRFFDEDAPFFEEPRPSSRKYDGYERRQNPDEKEKKKSRHVDPPVATRSTKERVREVRESVKKSRSDHAKYRDKERRKDRERSEKYPKAFVVSEPDNESELDSDNQYYTPKTPEPEYEDSRRRRKSNSSESKPKQSRDEEYSDERSKLDDAKKYIQRSKSGGYSSYDTAERRPSATTSWPSPSDYYSPHVETPPRRSSGRTRTRESVRPSSSGKDRRGSADVADLPLKSHLSPRPPTLQTATSAPSGLRFPISISSRSGSKPHAPRRSETMPFPGLSRRSETLPTRSSKMREPQDSGYSSPGTPEMHSGSSPPLAGRYVVVDESEEYLSHHAVRIEPKVSGLYGRTRSVSPPSRPSLSSVPQPPRSRTYNYPIDPTSMPSRSIPLRTTPHTPAPGVLNRDGLFGEVFPGEYDHPKIVIPEANIRYSPRIREEDISYSYGPRKGPLDPNVYRETYPRPYGSRKESVAC